MGKGYPQIFKEEPTVAGAGATLTKVGAGANKETWAGQGKILIKDTLRHGIWMEANPRSVEIAVHTRPPQPFIGSSHHIGISWGKSGFELRTLLSTSFAAAQRLIDRERPLHTTRCYLWQICPRRLSAWISSFGWAILAGKKKGSMTSESAQAAVQYLLFFSDF